MAEQNATIGDSANRFGASIRCEWRLGPFTTRLAMSVNAESFEPTLDRYRGFLLLLARAHLDPRLCAKLEASDVVQDVLLRAHQRRDQFRGSTEAEKAAWLGQILSNLLVDKIRRLKHACRVKSLEGILEKSSGHLADWAAAEQSTPSQHVERHETAMRVAEALCGLPDDQREALILKKLHGWPLAQIGQHMKRSPAAVAGLLRRGLQGLLEEQE